MKARLKKKIHKKKMDRLKNMDTDIVYNFQILNEEYKKENNIDGWHEHIYDYMSYKLWNRKDRETKLYAFDLLKLLASKMIEHRNEKYPQWKLIITIELKNEITVSNYGNNKYKFLDNCFDIANSAITYWSEEKNGVFNPDNSRPISLNSDLLCLDQTFICYYDNTKYEYDEDVLNGQARLYIYV